mgnify:CR=1 FL=1|tara:strand:+ start:100 stop:309 length:210 start_codon:yes stop_codon:yes gene_type:complete
MPKFFVTDGNHQSNSCLIDSELKKKDKCNIISLEKRSLKVFITNPTTDHKKIGGTFLLKSGIQISTQNF